MLMGSAEGFASVSSALRHEFIFVWAYLSVHPPAREVDAPPAHWLWHERSWAILTARDVCCCSAVFTSIFVPAKLSAVELLAHRV